MMPFFFGPSSRPLYGILDPAVGGGRTGVVLCQPSGPEYFYAHRSCRLLARTLAEAGVHALRFDPSGAGNSGGELEEVSADDWLTDVRLAIDELRSAAGVRSVTLVGLRVGCATALAAGLSDPDVEAFVLWDPLPSSEIAVGVPPGLPTCASTAQDFGEEDPREVLVVSNGEGSPPDALGSQLRSWGHDVEVITLEERGAWEAGQGIGSVPIPAQSIRSIVRWIGERL